MSYFVTEAAHAVIPEFPNYCVTVEGEVFNLKTGRRMVLSPTAEGDPTVGMMNTTHRVSVDEAYRNTQSRRSVKVLVAEAFVDGRSDEFNTPIQLDGDKNNLHADNILWRPRWFAWRYTSQFSGNFPDWYFDGPILDIKHDVEYLTIIGASTTQGILCNDILESIRTGVMVFPTGQIFIHI